MCAAVLQGFRDVLTDSCGLYGLLVGSVLLWTVVVAAAGAGLCHASSQFGYGRLWELCGRASVRLVVSRIARNDAFE